MPKFKPFTTTSAYLTAYGRLEIEGLGTIANITLVSRNNVEDFFKLETMPYSTLKKTMLYQQAYDESTELLLSSWGIKKTATNILIFSKDKPDALILTLADSSDTYIVDLIATHLTSCDFFKELQFNKFLEDQDTTLENLRDDYGIDGERMALLVDNITNFKKLVQFGITFDDLAAADINVLKRKLSSSCDHANAVLFVGASSVEEDSNKVTIYTPKLFPQVRSISSKPTTSSSITLDP